MICLKPSNTLVIQIGGVHLLVNFQLNGGVVNKGGGAYLIKQRSADIVRIFTYSFSSI